MPTNRKLDQHSYAFGYAQGAQDWSAGQKIDTYAALRFASAWAENHRAFHAGETGFLNTIESTYREWIREGRIAWEYYNGWYAIVPASDGSYEQDVITVPLPLYARNFVSVR